MLNQKGQPWGCSIGGELQTGVVAEPMIICATVSIKDDGAISRMDIGLYMGLVLCRLLSCFYWIQIRLSLSPKWAEISEYRHFKTGACKRAGSANFMG